MSEKKEVYCLGQRLYHRHESVRTWGTLVSCNCNKVTGNAKVISPHMFHILLDKEPKYPIRGTKNKEFYFSTPSPSCYYLSKDDALAQGIPAGIPQNDFIGTTRDRIVSHFMVLDGWTLHQPYDHNSFKLSGNYKLIKEDTVVTSEDIREITDSGQHRSIERIIQTLVSQARKELSRRNQIAQASLRLTSKDLNIYHTQATIAASRPSILDAEDYCNFLRPAYVNYTCPRCGLEACMHQRK